MSDRRRAKRYDAGVASPGLALGPVVHVATRPSRDRAAGTPEQEHTALQAAIDTAAGELTTLADGCTETAAEILKFQTALLDDEELTGPAFAAVDGGRSAHDAWADALDGEIADYRSSGDETLQARASDLEDLRDRVLAALTGQDPDPGVPGGGASTDSIYVADDLTPSRFIETDWRHFAGIALKAGSTAGHVAVLARARGLPMLVGLGDAAGALADGARTVLDAENGVVIAHPSADTVREMGNRIAQRARAAEAEERYLATPAVTADGERVSVMINADDPAVLATIDPATCDGVGLTRTEFLFHGDAGLPGEERQYETYRAVVHWAAGRPVTIRTLDAGGDKPIPGLTPDGETNPFLGLRGLRLSLARPEVFRVQLRALARVAAEGPLKVMVPMVTVPAEFAAFRSLFDQVVDDLRAAGVAAARPALGMMVEVPAAAMTAERFPADFFSIGSNDLVQYTTAAARDNAALATLADPRNPAVLELIGRVVEAGRRMGVEVSLCGDMAGEPDLSPLLLDRGLRALSVAPARLAATKAAVAGYRAG